MTDADLSKPYYECPEHGPIINVDHAVMPVGRARLTPGQVYCADCGAQLSVRVPRDPFPLDWTASLSLDELRDVADAAQTLAQQSPELRYRLAVTDAWVCLRLTGRRSHLDFGMWRATGEWFEADGHGAMGETPVDWSPAPRISGS